VWNVATLGNSILPQSNTEPAQMISVFMIIYVDRQQWLVGGWCYSASGNAAH